jgi:hypothetical protein
VGRQADCEQQRARLGIDALPGCRQIALHDPELGFVVAGGDARAEVDLYAD